MTTGLPPLSSGFDARKAALSLLAGFGTGVASGGVGFSASTSAAGLSSRSPLKAASRTKPALDLGDEVRLGPIHVRLLARRSDAGER